MCPFLCRGDLFNESPELHVEVSHVSRVRRVSRSDVVIIPFILITNSLQAKAIFSSQFRK